MIFLIFQLTVNMFEHGGPKLTGTHNDNGNLVKEA